MVPYKAPIARMTGARDRNLVTSGFLMDWIVRRTLALSCERGCALAVPRSPASAP
jgi:hypothetical protein